LGLNWAGTKLEKNLNNHQARTGWRAGFAKLNAVDKFERGLATKLQGAQLGTGTTNKAEKEYAQKTQSRANQTKAENDRKKEYSDNIKALEVKTKTDAELKTALEKLGIAIKGMSKDEKNKLDLEELKNQSVAIHLTDDDIKNLNESGKYSASEIDEIKSSRKSAYKSVATHGSTLTHKDAAGATVHSHGNAATIDMRSKIASLGSREVGKLPIEIFKEEKMFAHITPAMLDERMRNGIDAADLPQIRAALADHLRIPLNSTPSTAQVNGINMLLTSNPWVKWENGNSNYAAQFFA
jgi:hypothetical protein